jgi:chemotaxis protein MotB
VTNPTKSLCVGLWLALAGCASDEDALRQEVKDLRYDVGQAKQRNDDLKRRMQLAEARNRVLIDLVKGLTAEPGSSVSASGAPAELGRAHQSLAALDRDLQELAGTLRQSRYDMDALRGQRKSLEDELSRATHTIEQTRAEEQSASQRLLALREMLLHFKTMMAAGNLTVRVVNNRMVLQLPDTLLFDRGKDVIKREGRSLLDKVAGVLIAVGDREFQIAGHTATGSADAGRFESDWHLSAARAVNVLRYLVAHGVPKRRLSAVAHADTMPASVNSQEADRLNRRIEIVLVPLLNELPDMSVLDTLVTEPPTAQPQAEPAPATETKLETAPPSEEAKTEPEPEPKSEVKNEPASEPAPPQQPAAQPQPPAQPDPGAP